MDQDVSSAELKALREAAGLDLAVLARRVSLSTAQLEQLESGRDSLFYSPSIRRQAALKVHQYLDAQLQSPAAARRA
jgi:transcriptional regulator with XRE-family HTH domain